MSWSTEDEQCPVICQTHTSLSLGCCGEQTEGERNREVKLSTDKPLNGFIVMLFKSTIVGSFETL